MTMENKPLLQVKDLTVTFGERHNKFTAVKNVSFDIFQGETFGLVGESGSGKTTIGRTVIRINPAASGEILYDGERISGRISREKDREVTRKYNDLSGPDGLPQRTRQGGLHRLRGVV